ncbi:hypothetical protein LTS18_002864 [Coniosporium uncinatum]|uniref:Uncharacterized protein n=1 Tax=Coniosporium uncinatum TaxID=93489 RepID=A0ACC3DU45_9PEZI|nr:hypothetical protein LTS18_002864 [Coniosporium uncinatum]
MQFSTLSTVALLSSLASAHFTVNYPYWRGSSFDEGKSQWSWPCANVTQELSANNRTAWPLTGGSLNLKVSHPWAYTYVTLGLGNEVTSFNVSLLDHFNQTGNGTFCIPQLGAAQLAELGVQEGTNASLQVVQINEHGNALYNCADITFSSTATTLSGDACTNSSNVAGTALMNEADVSSSSSSSGSGTNGAASSNASPSAAAAGAAAPAVGIKGLGMTMAWIAAAVAGVGLVL